MQSQFFICFFVISSKVPRISLAFMFRRLLSQDHGGIRILSIQKHIHMVSCTVHAVIVYSTVFDSVLNISLVGSWTEVLVYCILFPLL